MDDEPANPAEDRAIVQYFHYGEGVRNIRALADPEGEPFAGELVIMDMNLIPERVIQMTRAQAMVLGEWLINKYKED